MVDYVRPELPEGLNRFVVCVRIVLPLNATNIIGFNKLFNGANAVRMSNQPP